MSSLRSKTIKGIAVLGAGKSLGKLVSFANTLILARILAPEDYGLMAMAMVVAGFVGFFNEIGLGSAIIQRKEVSSAQLSGAFYIALITCSILYFITYISAPYAAAFYENEQIELLLQVLAISFFFGAIKTVPDALLVKEMKFKVIAGIEFFSIILVCVVTLSLALAGFKTWSLVYGFLAGELFKTISILWLSQWRPSRTGSIRQAASLMKFGLTVTYSRLTWYLYTNASTLILGRVAGGAQTGIYSMAATIATLPTSHITSLIIQVASPLFSKLQEDMQGLNNALLKLSAGISLVSFPVLTGMMLTANELVPILLGEQWLTAIIPLQLMCIRGFFKSIDPLLTQAFISIGKANITAKYTSFCAVVIPLSLLLGALHSGINGAAFGVAIVSPLLLSVLLFLAKKHFQLSIKSYFAKLLSPLLASLFMAFILLSFEWFMLPILGVNIVLLLMIKVALGVASYSFWIIYVQKDGITLLQTVLSDLGVSQQKLNRWPFSRVEVE
ncbi:lipopolysaccharide biosynthesis protein [Litorilituus lipolyticus]|uniref:Lipopolysaccharide biosynthesis protein n=1 Tax=Litorilituus lipolyticus TaxID=2491017 RepID=A0A502KYK7_9GAMM|nr:lipopolysaccharide biosynthesis protein [Litorilituus lipolyticus]TPH13297.1 lipopolysaccharide biosynthesis protein [Litorilituus lipolyticus]